jgi:peroxiredoxin family protein
MGPKMIRGLMKKHGAPGLEEMIQQAGELGVNIYVCEMSMDLMGFKREELIDYPNMDYVGVATFLAHAKNSANQLFI